MCLLWGPSVHHCNTACWIFVPSDIIFVHQILFSSNKYHFSSSIKYYFVPTNNIFFQLIFSAALSCVLLVKGGGGRESKHRSMMLHLSLPASRKQSLLSLTININVETILKDFPRLIIISHSFSYTPVILENKVVSTGNPLGSTVKLNACRLLSGTKWMNQ